MSCRGPDGTAGRSGVTLNDLRVRRSALSCQLLLAVQLCDTRAQEAVRARLEETRREIDRMTRGR